MNKETPVNIVDAISLNEDDMAKEMVELQYKKQPELWEKYGPSGKKISIRDAKYHLSFLTEAINSNSVDMFADYINWVKLLFQGLGFPPEAMTENINAMEIVLSKYFDEAEFESIKPYIQKARLELNLPLRETKSFIENENPLRHEADKYIKLLLSGKKAEASKLILSLVNEGIQVKSIYLNIFQPAQYEIGNLWLKNKISVAQEHYCSAATQVIMSQLYPHILSSKRTNKTILAACVGNELHELGIRMVADFFEMEGWDTWYLGANTPTSSIIKTIAQQQVDVVGLSVSMPFNRPMLTEIIGKIRDEYNDNVKIMIGGHAVKNYNWKRFNAHAFAPDAQNAIITAQQLIKE